MSSTEHDQPAAGERPWVAANPGFVHPELPWRVCDWSRDYGYFATVEEARDAAAGMDARPEPGDTERTDHWMAEARKAIRASEAARDADDHELSGALANLAAACVNLASRYLDRARS